MHQSCFRAKANILPRKSRKVSEKSVNFIFQQVLAKAKGEILPGIINDAKASGKSAAKRVFDDRRGHIMATGCIPFYGWVKAPMLIADAKRDAINNAKHAAEETANSEFHSAAVKVCRQNLIDSNWNCNLFTNETLMFLKNVQIELEFGSFVFFLRRGKNRQGFCRLSLNGHLELVPALILFYSLQFTLFKDGHHCYGRRKLVPVPRVCVLKRVQCIRNKTFQSKGEDQEQTQLTYGVHARI